MSSNKNIVQRTTIPLTSIGLIVWIVFMVLWYGTGTLNASNFHVFWVWFPLWIPWAIEAVFTILVVILLAILE